MSKLQKIYRVLRESGLSKKEAEYAAKKLVDMGQSR